MIPVARLSGLLLGIFHDTQELSIDPNDGYIIESPTLKDGNVLTITLRIKKESPLLLCRAAGGAPKGEKRATDFSTVGLSVGPPPKGLYTRRFFDFRIALVGFGARGNIEPLPYPENALCLAIIGRPRFMLMGIVAQHENLFFRSWELDQQRIDEKLDFAVAAHKKMHPLEPTAASEDEEEVDDEDNDVLPDLEAMEEGYGAVVDYNDLSGIGTAHLEDDEDLLSPTALVRWSEILGDERFRTLKSGYKIAYREKTPLQPPNGKQEWELEGIRILRRDEGPLAV